MSEYLKSLEPNDAQCYIATMLQSSLPQQENVYLIHIPWLLKSEKKISTNFQILPGAISQNILLKCQVCTQRNQ